MQHCLYIFLLFVLISTTATAQQDAPFLYKQGEVFGLHVNSKKVLQLAFHPLKEAPPTVVTVRWTIKDKSITLSTPQVKEDKEGAFTLVTFSWPLFDAALEGHLEWGKTLLEQLDSSNTDSVVVVLASLELSKDSTVESSLPISFLGNWNTGDDFWNRAAQYKLLQQQVSVNDSIKFYKKEGARTEALMQLNQKATAATQASIQQIKEDLWKSCQDTTLIDSLLIVEAALSKGLEKARNGQAITNPEKMHLATQTNNRSQLLSQINGQKHPICQNLLQTLLKKTRILNNIQRQQQQLNQQRQQQQKKQNTFQDLYQNNSQQLETIVARLPK
ncbi:MAG: hypothetical protein ACRBFS_15540 [Aureispira sp.]